MMRALQITLSDLGGALDLDKLGAVLGHQASVEPMVLGASAGFGPFRRPRSIQFQDGELDVDIVLHAVGAIAYRLSRSIRAPYEELAWPDPVARWEGAIAQDVGPALYDHYMPTPTVETWEIRVLPERPDDMAAAQAFIMIDATGTNAPPPVLLERPDGGILLGRDRAVVWGRADDIIDVLELARAELLEFEAYDAYLDRRLDAAYRGLDRLWGRGGIFRSARGALLEFSKIRLELARLTDPLYGTDKAFGDRFTERLHAAAQQRLGIDAWERAVAHKAEVLEDMFHLAQEETNHRRGMLLEAMIVLLFILDLLLLWKLG